MARLPRFVLPDYPQHVIQRGNNAQRILFDEADYWFLWERLGAGAAKFHCDIHAYVLMPTHLHLVVTPHAEDGIGKMMQYVGRYYVRYFNQRYDRTGTLWDGRYRATLLDPRRWLNTCARYVEQNPVRAGLVTEAGAYDWSSHGANCGGREDTLVCPHPAYLALGRSIRARQEAWRALVGRAPAGGRPGTYPRRHQQGMGPGGPGLLRRDRGQAQPPRHTPGPWRRPPLRRLSATGRGGPVQPSHDRSADPVSTTRTRARNTPSRSFAGSWRSGTGRMTLPCRSRGHGSPPGSPPACIASPGPSSAT